MTETNTLVIRVEDDGSFHERVAEGLEAIERGDRTPATERSLSLRSEAALARIFTESNLEIIRTIADEEPASIRELARLVERDKKDVHRNVTELAELGAIDLEPEKGSKRPTVWYDEISVSYPVRPAASG